MTPVIVRGGDRWQKTATRGKTILGWCATLILLATAAPAIAQSVVLRAEGPSAKSYEVGRVLPADTKVTLVSRDILVLLDSRGTRTLHGPASIELGVASPEARSVLVGLMAKTQSRRPVIAGTRDKERQAFVRPHSLWQMDAYSAGSFCLLPGIAPELWRAEMTRAEVLSITRLSDNTKVSVTWAKGMVTARWPFEQTAGNDDRYIIEGEDGTRQLMMVRYLASKNDNILYLAEQFHKNNCIDQLIGLSKG